MTDCCTQVYPRDEYITGGTLYQYLHISKRKMKYLLENGYIPYIDTGKKTHRYIVKKADAEQFKIRLETDMDMIITIQGKFGKSGSDPNANPPIEPTAEESHRFKQFLTELWRREPDAMPAKRVSALSGYQPQRIYKLCEDKKLFSARVNDMIYCSKESVITYFSSIERISKPNATKGYSELIKKYAAWRNK